MRQDKQDIIRNFLPINRKFFRHPFWNEKRTFSKSEAWIDLIQSARFEESEAAELMGGKLVRWSRGQVPGSIRFLADRWIWSKSKVEDFLKLLETEGMISRSKVNGQTVITLCNYEEYNGGQQNGRRKRQVNEPQKRDLASEWDSKTDSEADNRGTASGQPPDETNKDNKVNTEEEIAAPAATDSPAVRFKKFQSWISVNAPKVSQMRYPFKLEEFVKIRDAYHLNDIMEVLQAMHNKRTLLKDYESAYLTANNWLKMRRDRGENRKDFTTNEANADIKAALQQKGA